MTYKIGICDDESTVIEYEKTIVNAWASSKGHNIVLRTFNSAESFLFQYEEENNYDILLLDIEMGNMNGLTLAKKIREKNELVQIIFITGYSEYISEGYEVAALHYLMKPVKEKKLLDVLSRASERLKKNDKALFLETTEGITRIPLFEIRYLEVNQNYVTIHGKEDITIKKPLKELEAELDERFFRIGRSYIINLNIIERVSKKDVYLNSGEVIPLPRGMYEPLNRAIISHI